MFFNSLEKKLKKSYASIDPEIAKAVFPYGEPEYIYVGTMLDYLFKKHDIFELIRIYSSVYTYYKSTLGNISETYKYAQKKSDGILFGIGIKNLIALIMLNLAENKEGISNPVQYVNQYRNIVDSYLETVKKIKEHEYHFTPNTVDAGTVDGPLLVNGISGVRDYINSLKIQNVEEITYKRTSTLYLEDKNYDVNYAIDEYTLYNAKDSSELAVLWFNIYGSENTDIQPACLSGKKLFSAEKVTPELFDVGIQELQTVETIIQNMSVKYDSEKIFIATLTYFYVIWIFSFNTIRMYQSEQAKKIYIECFTEHLHCNFKNTSDEKKSYYITEINSMLERVDARVRNSYHKHNRTLIDDGLTYEFLSEFISDEQAILKIKPYITKIIMEDWVAIGKYASERFLT